MIYLSRREPLSRSYGSALRGTGNLTIPRTASLGGGRIRAPDWNHDDHGAEQAGTARTRGDVRITDNRGADGATGASFRHYTLGAPMTVVLAQEIGPPDETKPMEWLLLTTLAVAAAEDAERIVTWYSSRWRIERLHVTWKSGGGHVEDLPLESRARLERAITRYSMVAWRLLWMTYQVRVNPNQSPTVAFSLAEIAVLERLAAIQKPARPAGHPLTLRYAVRAMAKLGGVLGRKSDGEPGVKPLGRGYRQLPLLDWWDEVPRNPS